MSILALETSCDDTCAAVLEQDGTIRSNVISSQEQHSRFGGVVPEIASRHHLELIDAVVAEALSRADSGLGEVELVAATRGPGLIGALLVGLSSAKAIAAARELPFAAVDHLQGHVAANFVRADGGPFEPPFTCLIASGGHTLLAEVHSHDGFEVLGTNARRCRRGGLRQGRQDARPRLSRGRGAGAAGDGWRPRGLLFPGSPGERRRGRSPSRAAFAEGLDFSFAGVKTALLYKLRELPEQERSERAPDLAASYQAAIVESLISRTERALRHTGSGRLAVGGGVAANGELRRRLGELEVELHVPDRAPLHRQRRDDRQRRPLRRAARLPPLPRARRLRQRRASLSVPPCPS